MLQLREDIQVYQHAGVSHCLNDSIFTDSDKKEIYAHKTYEEERAKGNVGEVDVFDEIIFKSDFIRSFKQLISKLQLTGKETVLEMGGGWCWASTLLKRMYPDAYIVASDLIPTNLQHTAEYEKIVNAYIDEKWAFSCRNIPFDSEQFDRIFTFAAFHHFGEKGDYSKSLKEMVRVLKTHGKMILLYEPSSPQYLYKWAYQRVNRDPYAEEDVLVISRLQQILAPLKCSLSVEFFPLFLYREGFTQTVYYYLLSKFQFLQKWVPCTVNIVIDKQGT